jgi:hypothetical protein
MAAKLPDAEAACNLIASVRREERNYARRNLKTKSVTIPLEMIGGLQLSSNVMIKYNSATDIVLTPSSSLVFRKSRIHPGTNDKRRCDSKKALKMLKDSRRYKREGRHRRREQKEVI